jgi:hypothetical protein
MVAFFSGMIYEFNVVDMEHLKRSSHDLKGFMIVELSCNELFDWIDDVIELAMH